MAKQISDSSMASDANLIHLWKFEGNSTDTPGDADGTDTDITYGADYGRYTQGASFNGTSSQISIGNEIPLNATDFTICFNIYVATLTGYDGGSVISKTTTSGGEEGWWMSIGSNGKPAIRTFTAAAGQKILESTSVITLGTWNHVALLNDADGNKSVYLNGVLDSTGSADGQSIGTNTATCYIGRIDNVTPYRLDTTYLDDLGIFNRLLTAGEILELGNNKTGTPLFFSQL